MNGILIGRIGRTNSSPREREIVALQDDSGGVIPILKRVHAKSAAKSRLLSLRDYLLTLQYGHMIIDFTSHPGEIRHES